MIVDIFNHKIFKTKNSKSEILYNLLVNKYKPLSEINGSLVSPCTHDFTTEHWWNLYSADLDLFLSEMSLTGTIVQKDIWINAYNKGLGLDKHDHGDVPYIGMHFVKLQNAHPQTKFYENENSDDFKTLGLVEQDLIIIPGSLYHSVDENSLQDLRITAVFAFSVE